MKSFISLVMAAILGGLFVLLGSNYFHSQSVDDDQLTSQAQLANHAVSKVSFDFTLAAEIAMPTVVHIKASESTQSANERRYRQRQNYFDPFSFFFGQDNYRGNNHRQIGYGSGVIINKGGLIVTNNHVIDFADELEVTLNDNRTFTARLVGRDPQSDLALIQINEEGIFDFISFGNSDDVKIGQWVVAVGNPFDLTSTVTAGIVSAKGRSNIIKEKNAIEDFIQTDAVVNPGNSGGALLNTEGDLIGINTAIASPDGIYAGYAFAIPSNLVQSIVSTIKSNAKSQMSKPGYLGIEVQNVTAEAVSTYRLYTDKGVFISAIDPQSPAAFAGLSLKDVIVKVDGTKVETIDDLNPLLKGKKAGDKIKFSIVRANRIIEIPVILRTSY